MKILTVALGVTPPIAFAAHNPFYAQAQTPETVLHEFYKTPEMNLNCMWDTPFFESILSPANGGWIVFFGLAVS